MRVWVSDDLNPSEIELDQRSAGMQYFFSFFLVFLVESEDAHANSILLLDEPGTSLHGTAQAKIVEFLRTLTEGNQVIYTTHSPFMIDADHLETVRPVYEEPGTGATRITEDVWPKDKDALFPLQAALGLPAGPVPVHLQTAGPPRGDHRLLDLQVPRLRRPGHRTGGHSTRRSSSRQAAAPLV